MCSLKDDIPVCSVGQKINGGITDCFFLVPASIIDGLAPLRCPAMLWQIDIVVVVVVVFRDFIKLLSSRRSPVSEAGYSADQFSIRPSVGYWP